VADSNNSSITTTVVRGQKPAAVINAIFAGTAGINLADLLHQQEVWVDRHGKKHELDQMPTDYKARVYAFMLRRAPGLAVTYTAAILSCGGDWEDFHDTDEGRVDDPQRWLADTPLMRRLAADVYNLPKVLDQPRARR
jgi:hypothetical protein